MYLKVIKTKKDYQAALARFETIFQSKEGRRESEEADVLALLIQHYEDKHYIIAAPDPLAAIKYRMEQQGLTNNDLARILGYKSRVTDLFRGNRKLNLGMIRSLHAKLNIPLETLVQDYNMGVTGVQRRAKAPVKKYREYTSRHLSKAAVNEAAALYGKAKKLSKVK